MRVAAPFLAAFLLAGLPTGAQDGLPQIASTPGQLRALSTLDEAADWEAIGRVDTPVSFCSGTLIAPDLVLTAAHCLYDDDGRRLADRDITFAASLRNDRAEAFRAVRRAFALPDYPGPVETNQADAIALDIAILELDRSIPVQMVRPVAAGSAGRVRDLVTVVSYGAERETHASIEEGCTVLARDAAILILDCDAVSGSSGAPILRVNQGRSEVIAVVSANAEWQGRDVAIAVSVDPLLPDLLAQRQGVVGPARLPGAVRRLTPGETGRDGIGARFIRP